MESLKRKETLGTPNVFFSEKGILIISGKCLPENAINFFEPIIKKIDRFIEKNQSINITCELEYINSSSSKVLYQLLEKVVNSGIKQTINWYYEEDDEDMKELGEDYETLLKTDFNFKEIHVTLISEN